MIFEEIPIKESRLAISYKKRMRVHDLFILADEAFLTINIVIDFIFFCSQEPYDTFVHKLGSVLCVTLVADHVTCFFWSLWWQKAYKYLGDQGISGSQSSFHLKIFGTQIFK